MRCAHIHKRSTKRQLCEWSTAPRDNFRIVQLKYFPSPSRNIHVDLFNYTDCAGVSQHRGCRHGNRASLAAETPHPPADCGGQRRFPFIDGIFCVVGLCCMVFALISFRESRPTVYGALFVSRGISVSSFYPGSFVQAKICRHVYLKCGCHEMSVTPI